MAMNNTNTSISIIQEVGVLDAVLYTPAFQVCEPTWSHDDSIVRQPFSALTAGPWIALWYLFRGYFSSSRGGYSSLSWPVKTVFLLQALTQCTQVLGHSSHVTMANGWNKVFLCVVTCLPLSMIYPLSCFFRNHYHDNMKAGAPNAANSASVVTILLALAGIMTLWLVYNMGRFLAVGWILLCLTLAGEYFLAQVPKAKRGIRTAAISLWIAEIFGIVTDGIYCHQLQAVAPWMPWHAIGHLLIDQVAVQSFNQMLIDIEMNSSSVQERKKRQ